MLLLPFLHPLIIIKNGALVCYKWLAGFNSLSPIPQWRYLCWAKATKKSKLGLNKWDECAVNKCFLCPNRSYRNKHGCQLNYNSVDLIMKSKHFRLNCITPPLHFIAMWFWLCLFLNLMNFIPKHKFYLNWRLASHVQLLYMCKPKDNLREKCT